MTYIPPGSIDAQQGTWRGPAPFLYPGTAAPRLMARGYRAAAFTYPATGGQTTYPYIFDTTTQNDSGCFNTTTGYFTCPVAGVYAVHAQISASLGASTTLQAQVYKNDVLVRLRVIFASSTAAQADISYTDRFAVGDQINFGTASGQASVGGRMAQAEQGFSITYLGA